MKSRFFVFALLFALIAAPALAEDYAPPTWPNLMRTLVRFRAIDLGDPSILDEFSVITECELYAAFYKNDFKWQQVRQAVRASAAGHVATYPTGYSYDVPLHLDRYDFSTHVFRFAADSALRNINALMLLKIKQPTACGTAPIHYMPLEYRVVLAAPVYMDGLPLGEKDAHALLAQMDKDGDKARTIYARFNLRITYIDPLRKALIDPADHSGGAIRYSQSNAGEDRLVRLDGRLESLAFYSDPGYTRLIYKLQL